MRAPAATYTFPRLSTATLLGPESPDARTEKAVVESEEKAEYYVEPCARHSRVNVFVAESRLQKSIDRHGSEEDGNAALEEGRINMVHDNRAERSSKEGDGESDRAIAQRDGFGLSIMPGGTGGAEC